MTPRHKLSIAAMIAALAGLSLAISAMPGATAAPPALPVLTAFTWTDAHSGSHDWDDSCNWGGFFCVDAVPSSPGDTATFPDSTGTWTVLHRQYTIGTLTCEEGVDFTGTTTLTAEKFVIDASASANDLSVTISGTGGEIIANP